MPFAMSTEFYQKRRANTGTTFYCPAGHPQHYTGESDAAKIARLNQEIQRERQQHDQTKSRAKDAESKLDQAKRKASKLRKRASEGKCPCCQEKFNNLEQHMKSEHPGYGTKKQAAKPTA